MALWNYDFFFIGPTNRYKKLKWYLTNTLEQAWVEWLSIKTNPNIKSTHKIFIKKKKKSWTLYILIYFFCKNPKGFCKI